MLARMPGIIRVERDGPLARVIFDHPERRNAVTTAMWKQIPEIARSLDADPSVREDLERFMTDLVPDGAQRYLHGQAGDDDMPAHIRTVLSENSLSMPVEHARLMLGTWHGIYLWEHRTHACQRNIVVTVFGN